MWVYWPISKQINNTILQFSKIDYYKPSNWNADIQLTSISKFNPNIYIDERQNIRNFFNPNSKSNSFSEHFNTKSHNLVVNFFILTIDTPTYLSNQTNLPRPPNKIFFLTNIPLKVTAPYLRCRQTKNKPTRTVHGHIFHTLYYYYWVNFKQKLIVLARTT